MCNIRGLVLAVSCVSLVLVSGIASSTPVWEGVENPGKSRAAGGSDGIDPASKVEVGKGQTSGTYDLASVEGDAICDHVTQGIPGDAYSQASLSGTGLSYSKCYYLKSGTLGYKEYPVSVTRSLLGEIEGNCSPIGGATGTHRAQSNAHAWIVCVASNITSETSDLEFKANKYYNDSPITYSLTVAFPPSVTITYTTPSPTTNLWAETPGSYTSSYSGVANNTISGSSSFNQAIRLIVSTGMDVNAYATRYARLARAKAKASATISF